MLKYEDATELYHTLQTKSKDCAIEDFDEFYEDFLKLAVSYAKVRSDWSFLTLSEQNDNDAGRTIQHEAFMSALGAVCRFLNVKDIDMLLPDRKTKGDFACYIALFLALEQR